MVQVVLSWVLLLAECNEICLGGGSSPRPNTKHWWMKTEKLIKMTADLGLGQTDLLGFPNKLQGPEGCVKSLQRNKQWTCAIYTVDNGSYIFCYKTRKDLASIDLAFVSPTVIVVFSSPWHNTPQHDMWDCGLCGGHLVHMKKGCLNHAVFASLPLSTARLDNSLWS